MKNHKYKQRVGYTESKLILKGNNLKTRKHYMDFITKYPTLNLARNPEAKFHDTGEWKGWDDYLNTGKINPINIKKLSYHKAKKFVRSLGIKTSNEYFALKRKGSLPNLPFTPKSTYKKYWEGWHKFLGTKPTTQHRKWVSFEVAKQWARKHNIKTQKEWDQIKKPINIPSDPARVYSAN